MDLPVGWENAKPVHPEIVEKDCMGENCLRTFLPRWHTAKRCDQCRKEKRPYKKTDEPF